MEILFDSGSGETQTQDLYLLWYHNKMDLGSISIPKVSSRGEDCLRPHKETTTHFIYQCETLNTPSTQGARLDIWSLDNIIWGNIE
uniref:Putative ovule protein n=1 Tax=Solanum chacoense TaxID=4108 RepID=A0A0V0H5Q0_SOLCH